MFKWSVKITYAAGFYVNSEHLHHFRLYFIGNFENKIIDVCAYTDWYNASNIISNVESSDQALMRGFKSAFSNWRQMFIKKKVAFKKLHHRD